MERRAGERKNRERRRAEAARIYTFKAGTDHAWPRGESKPRIDTPRDQLKQDQRNPARFQRQGGNKRYADPQAEFLCGKEPLPCGKQERTTGHERPPCGKQERTTGKERRTCGKVPPPCGKERLTCGKMRPARGHQTRIRGEERRPTGRPRLRRTQYAPSPTPHRPRGRKQTPAALLLSSGIV